ncbi:MAG: hypothetical protein RLZZ543_504, partial [Bacteroidota bacterium]
YPNFSISSYLILPDKNCINPIEDLAGKFEMIKQIDKNGFTSIDAVFKGNPEEVRKVGLLTKIDVTEEVDALLEEMQTESLKLEKQLQSGKKPKAKLGCFCRDCEFSVASDTFGESGFETCWGPAAHTQPHILELGQLGNVNEDEKVDKLIRRGKSSIYDIPVDWLKGKWNNRPWLQRTQNQPFLFEGFHKEVSKLQWPIHFIDFETAQPALPHYAGMKPYQKLLFQWSAHRLDAPDAQPIHSSWLHDSRHMPNPEFLQSLMDCLGNSGSILTWSAYEQGVLNALSHEPATTAHQKAWIRSALSRLVDMNQWAIKYYFHPDTGGKTSIKVTLPAVLKSSKSPLTSMWLKELDVFTTDNNGAIINPYEMLPALDLPGLTDGVHDGSGAMLAYHFLQHGEAAKNPELKAQYRDALLRYCQLDTLAMLIIWEEWGAMNERPDPSHISH